MCSCLFVFFVFFYYFFCSGRFGLVIGKNLVFHDLLVMG